jgi:flavin-dependent dehydrogenase
MNQAAEQFDVIVVGGGPAGSCSAGLLAQEGRRVLLLERDKFPRYHIGESLISGVWKTLDRLGVREQLDQLGFVRKYGASVLWGKDMEFWRFAFRTTGPYDYVHQVLRADFDALLLGRARELGARVIEDAVVKEAVLDGDRLVGVRYQIRGQDEVVEATAPLTLDCSGQQRWLGRQFDLVEWHEDLRNIAVWSYYQGCQRYEGELAGHTLIERTPDGWFWLIPMFHDTTSIGYVTPTAVMAGTGLPIEQLFETRLEQSSEVKRLMEGATKVSGYRTARDWSYTCTRFHGPGWALVGDAAAFIDPLLSTGVTLALRAARIVVKAAAVALDDPSREQEALAAYEDKCREFLNVILDFVRYFYNQALTREDYYRGAQEMIDPDKEAPPDFDFVKLVSGLACENEELDLAMPSLAKS